MRKEASERLRLFRPCLSYNESKDHFYGDNLMTDASSRLLRVFLCHSSGDKPIVRELYQKLTAESWLDVWLDEEKLLPGMDWNLEIEEAVEAADVIIVCLSSNSVTKEGYVQRELRFALDLALEKPEGTIFVIPLRLDNCEPPRRLRGWQYADYFPESLRAKAYQRMLESLKARARRLSLQVQGAERIPTSDEHPSPLPTPPDLVPASPDKSLPPKPRLGVTNLRAVIKGFTVWKYVRILIIFLLISGFFGPWFEVTACNSSAPETSTSQPASSLLNGYQEYFLLISSKSVGVIIPLVVLVLFLFTLARLIPWKYQNRDATVRIERLAAALAPIVMSIEKYSATFTIFSSVQLLWGFWLSIVAAYLAPANILFEQEFTRQPGQKRQRWVWLVFISIIIALAVPWLFALLIALYQLLTAKNSP